MIRFIQSAGAFAHMMIIVLCGASTGCINNIDCQNPPPVFQFQIRDGNYTYPSDLDSALTIKIWYLEAGKQKYIEDISRIEDAFSSLTLIGYSRDLKDPELTFELNGRVLTVVKLETYIDKGKCDGWAHISKILQYGESIKDRSGIYLLGKK